MKNDVGSYLISVIFLLFNRPMCLKHGKYCIRMTFSLFADNPENYEKNFHIHVRTLYAKDIRHRAFRLVGRVWSPCLVFWFSDVLMSCFLLLKGTHSPTDVFHRVARVPLFTPFLCLFFRPPFWQRLNPKALNMRAPKHLKIIKKCKKSHRNAPTVRTCKKTQSGRGQTSEIDNLYNTFSCFPKGPLSK